MSGASSIALFASQIKAKFETGYATEHSYRSALEGLFERIRTGVSAINEPKRVACGAPDLSIQVGNIVVGHCEAKDVSVNLDRLQGADAAQLERYRRALPNLIYTNGLNFKFYKSGSDIRTISIAEFTGGSISPLPNQFEELAHQLIDFIANRPPTITSASVLTKLMAGKAVLIKDVMAKAIRADGDSPSELTAQYEAIRKHLIHDISVDDFADIYAETIAYGLFAARLHDSTANTFSRSEALELLPKSNPFLRSLFGYIAGVDLDERVRWLIDELADVFRACDMSQIMRGFGSLTGKEDPFLHFYETFLAEYNPTKRKARGVWYTPEPVVSFIVRSVDALLTESFGLPLGLSDTGTVQIEWNTGQNAKIKKRVHRIQVLDPAVGTGTFLAAVLKQIAAKVQESSPGAWSAYVEKELVPRVYGFELLMASYAMCHIKLDMVLRSLGYVPSRSPPRLGVYLTNSLEEGDVVVQSLFAQWLATEARNASEIKRQMPIMCIVGNPPYSGESKNKGEWITRLIDVYKHEPGGRTKLKEKNSKWLNDDYVKFMRFSEHMIEKNGEGVVGMITPHGYLDNPTFRGCDGIYFRHSTLFTFSTCTETQIEKKCPPMVRATRTYSIFSKVLLSFWGSGKDDLKEKNVRPMFIELIFSARGRQSTRLFGLRTFHP